MIALDISVSSPDLEDDCPFLRDDMTSWERGECVERDGLPSVKATNWDGTEYEFGGCLLP